MNILFLCHYFPPEVNAPATRTYEHCKRWVASGHNVTVVTCAPNCPDGIVYEGYKNRYTRELVDGINVVRVWTFMAPNKGFIKRIVNYLTYMTSAVMYSATKRSVDVVIATSPQFFCGWAGVLLKWLRKWPFILEIRDIWPESIVTVGAMKKSRVITMLEYLEKKMYRVADHIVAVGEGYRQNIVGKGIAPQKISVVLNGVDIERFALVKNTTEIKRKYGGNDKFVCSYIGTVGMAHGLEVMLSAAKLNKLSGNDDVVYWVVGDGAQREELESKSIADGLDNVVFTGRLPKDEMPCVIAASDCCLVHLRGSELFSTVIPSKIFEFMAMNVPIVMAVKGEAQHIVTQASAGVVMDPDDPNSLIRCIGQIRMRMSEYCNSRNYVATHFNRDKLANDMLQIIEKIAKTEK